MRKSILFLLTSLIVLQSCMNHTNVAIPISKDASLVYNINPSSLAKKYTLDDIADSKFFIQLYVDNKDTILKTIISNPYPYGLDFSKLISVSQTPFKGQLFQTVGMFLKDSELFEKSLNVPEQYKIINKGTYKYIIVNNMAIGWNNEFAILVNNQIEYIGLLKGENNNSNNNIFENIESFYEYYFNMKEDDRINNNQEFIKSLNQKSDITSYINFSNMYKPILKKFGISDTTKYFNNLYSIGSINFENGKLVTNSTIYPNEDLKQLIPNFKNKVNLSHFKHLGTTEVILGLAIEMPPQTFDKLPKLLKSDSTLFANLEKADLELSELKNIFGNTFFVGFNDLEENETVEDLQNRLSIGLEIKDPKKFQKVVNFLNLQFGEAFESNLYYNDRYLVFTKNSSRFKKLEEGYKPAQLNRYANNLKGTMGGVFIDMSKILTYQQKTLLEVWSPTQLDYVIETLKGMNFSIKEVNGEIKFKLTFEIGNQKQNSFKSLMQLIDNFIMPGSGQKKDSSIIILDEIVPN